MIIYYTMKTAKNTMIIAFKIYSVLFMALVKAFIMAFKVVGNYVKK